MSVEPNENSKSPPLGYKRDTKLRIFVNRSLCLDSIRFFGFDMDYTLAQYKSPFYEELAFQILRDRLVEIGYPQELASFSYEPSFPIRGLWFDTLYGTLLKMDQFGSVLVCLRGLNIVPLNEILGMYPNKFVTYDESRIIIMNTLFDLPKMYILACVIHIFHNDPKYTKVEHGVKLDSVYMSYHSIHEDVDNVVNWMHQGVLKKRTMENLEKYVEKNPELPLLLDKLRSRGAKVFLLTNSDFTYSQAIMTYMLEEPGESGEVRPWTSYFDFILTDAKKPLFFDAGTILRALDENTGHLSIGHHIGPLQSGKIYSGGSCEVFTQLIGARGKDVLYAGDHIFGDILKSKKKVGWRTFLVVPELTNEIYVWKKKSSLFDRLQYLDNKLADAYKDMNIETREQPDVANLRKEIRAVAQEMERSYGLLGSIFRSGSRHTFFSAQAMRYADIYSFSCFNLLHYPLCYMFRAPTMLMPHESTVPHSDSRIGSFADLEETPCGLRRRSYAGPSNIRESDFYTSRGLFDGEGHHEQQFDRRRPGGC
uniref:Cytosolic purine 5'-nucleotidase n=1 Tax=Mesocestoides corti TaxID=53468 RepID=A0A5K3EI21_MESCO